MILKSQKILAWPICIVFLVGLYMSGSGNVLCIDLDGNIEIEKSGLFCCDDSEDSCKTNQADNPEEDHENCSYCTDLELCGLLWFNVKSNFDKTLIVNANTLKMATIDTHLESFANDSGIHRVFSQTNDINPSLLDKKSIVLRC